MMCATKGRRSKRNTKKNESLAAVARRIASPNENEKKRKGKLKYVNGVKHASYGIGLGPIVSKCALLITIVESIQPKNEVAIKIK